MMNVLVGNNAAGKTAWLRSIGEQHIGECVSNIPELERHIESLDSRILDDLELTFEHGDIISSKSDILIVGYDRDFSKGFREMLTLACASTDWLLLDEPDACMVSEDEIIIFYDTLARTQDYHKNIYVATHCDFMVTSYMDNLFTIVDGELVPVTEGLSEYHL